MRARVLAPAIALALTSLPAVAATAAADPPYQLRHVHTGYCLGEDGGLVDTYRCDPKHEWHVSGDPGGMVFEDIASKRCLEVARNGRQVSTSACDGAPVQRWALRGPGRSKGTLENTASHTCLSYDFRKVTAEPCDAAKGQQQTWDVDG
ncbi:RICIN domain-containing protein [Amycolatopsis samaneae]|uniref:Ricin-type beta-trefoil lectin domain protein n=1 Tax=Amycolatopsis samaneae TaxID=664691 RepID=A0ABW5G9L7_9PSEU